MSEPELIQRKNPLSHMVRSPGGMRVCDAVAAAERNVKAMEPENIAEVDRNLALLVEAAGRAPDDLSAREKLYGHAAVIAGLGGNCGLDELGRAAFSLCEIADRYQEAGQWSPEAVAIHLNAMAILRKPGTMATAAMRKSVLAGLNQLVAHQASG
jgi:hypothetical protein